MNEAILDLPSRTPDASCASHHGTPPAVWLSRLSLHDFRCYATAMLEADARPGVLIGPNGAGKTNLLEAISFLAPGRGLRGARLDEVDRRVPGETAGNALGDASQEAPSATTWAVAAEVQTPHGPRQLGTGRDGTTGAGRRVVKIDGTLVRARTALSEIVSVVWLTPQMDGLFRDAPSGRRRFLDRLVYGFDPAHAGRVAAYEQSLRERARLLRTGCGDEAWLSALEDAMARHGVAIAAARRELVLRLAACCAEVNAPFPAAAVAVTGDVEAWLDTASALEAEERLRSRLAAARGADAEVGGAAVGPHR
ncbi:MAG: hypothetical protein D6826_01810, partial [Alphaproteobacteria bacterium]